MKTIIPLITALFITLTFIGCNHHSEVTDSLDTAERMMYESPDTSYMILADIDLSDIKSESDRALYCLLLSQAKYRNYIVETDDSIVSIAVDYYANTEDLNHKMLAYLYRGITRYDAKNYTSAIIDLLNAEKAAKSLNDYFYLGMIYRSMTDIYNKYYDQTLQIKYAQLAYDSFLKSSAKSHTAYAELDLSIAKFNSGNYAETRSICLDVIRRAIELDDSTLLSEARQMLGAANYKSENFKTAVQYLRQSINDDLAEADLYTLNLLGLSYLGLNNIDSVKAIMNIIRQIDPNEKLLEKEFGEAVGDKDMAANALLSEYNYQRQVFDTITSNSIAQAIAQFTKQSELEDDTIIHKQQSRIQIIILVLIVCIGVVYYLIYLHFKSRKKLISATIEGARDISESRVKDNTDMFKILSPAFTELTSLCDAFHESSGNSKKEQIIYKHVVEIIDKLKIGNELYLQIQEYLDKTQDNIISELKQQLPQLDDVQIALFTYYALDVSPKTISLLIDKTTNTVYTRKVRLRKRIEESDIVDKQRFVSILK